MVVHVVIKCTQLTKTLSLTQSFCACYFSDCRPGFYKSLPGNAKCAKCPPHSYTHQEGSVHCSCEKNYFRAEKDPVSMACTRPPSAPRNVISNINETSVILDWTWPADTGGRKDVTFSVVCKKCGASAQQCEPCRGAVRFLPRRVGLTNTTVTVADLLAHTTYTFEIEALNGSLPQGNEVELDKNI
ncbi:UNVERIFIED_CONTAM: hypothetical protein FKN15_069965 [Acipenser sinensis]